MKEYIGTKVVQAEPAHSVALSRVGCATITEVLTEKEIQEREDNGWDVHIVREGYKVVYKDGYKSWSPKDVFEAAYRETSCMTNIDRILRGDKEALVNEIHDIVKWARELTGKEWWNMNHDSDGGLRGVIRRIVDTHMTGSGTNAAAANKIYDICIQVAQITGAEVEELREIARGQREYTHPLKMATTKKQNDLGKHNDAVLDALMNLKTVIESGAHLAE